MRFWRKHNPKKPAKFALADREPRCARCWRDLTNRESWLFKCTTANAYPRLPGPDHFCRACRYADGEETHSTSFVWEREW